MSDLMPIEQAEFIDELQRWFHESTNMCREDCYRFAFVIWQHKDKLSQMFGYEKGRADGIREFAEWLSNTEYVANHESFILPLRGCFTIDEIVKEFEEQYEKQ